MISTVNSSYFRDCNVDGAALAIGHIMEPGHNSSSAQSKHLYYKANNCNDKLDLMFVLRDND